MRLDAVISVFLILSFKPASLSYLTLIKRLFSSSLLSAIRVASSAHLRLLDLSPSNLDSSLWFIQPQHFAWCTLLGSKISRRTLYSLVIILSQFWGSQLFMPGSNCCFLTCIQVSQETGKVVWYFYFFKNFQSALIHTVKGFSMVNEAEVDILLEFTCFLYDPMNVGSLISGSSASLKPSLYIWKFLVHILLKTGLKDFWA